MPGSDLRDVYSEYIMMNSDLDSKTKKELYDMVVWIRTAVRFHRDYKDNKTNMELELYRICLPEERDRNLGCEKPESKP
jgi:hypothetical protein